MINVHQPWLHHLLTLVMGLVLSASASPSEAKTHMLFVTPDNCKLIKGYSKHDLQGVAQAYKVPISKVSFVRAEWGRGPGGGPQCNMVFDTPYGPKSCAVFSIIKDDFVFGQAVPIPGNTAICR